jgi:hypothetical protein
LTSKGIVPLRRLLGTGGIMFLICSFVLISAILSELVLPPLSPLLSLPLSIEFTVWFILSSISCFPYSFIEPGFCIVRLLSTKLKLFVRTFPWSILELFIKVHDFLNSLFYIILFMYKSLILELIFFLSILSVSVVSNWEFKDSMVLVDDVWLTVAWVDASSIPICDVVFIMFSLNAISSG